MSKYEQILGRPLTDAEKAKLAYAEQSRPAASYNGAVIGPWDHARGEPAPAQSPVGNGTTPKGFDGVGAAAGKRFGFTPGDAQLAAAKGYVNQGQADASWAEATGGPVSGSPYPNHDPVLHYSANVPAPGGGTAPLLFQEAKPKEVENLVAMGVIDRATADRIYSKRNENDPMQTLRANTAAQQPLVSAAPGLPSNTPTGLQPSSAVVPVSNWTPMDSGPLKPSGGKPEPLQFGGASDVGSVQDTQVWEDSMGAPFRADHPSLKQSQTLYADKGAKLKASMGAALAEKKKGK